MRFCPLSTTMLRFRLDEEPEIEERWFTQRIADLIAYDPEGCLALMDGEEPVGMITTTCYQTVGWIGWLYVAEKVRNRGLGERLMQKAVGHIQARGMNTVALEAVVEAVSLYERLGFVQQFSTHHYLLKNISVEPDRQIDICEFGECSLDEVSSFDSRFFEQDRSRIFGLMQDNANFHGWVARYGGAIVGLLFGSEAEEDIQAGPLLVDKSFAGHVTVAAALCERMLGELAKPLRLRCPIVRSGRESIIEQLGAEFSNYRTIRMYLGGEYELERDGTLSLGCPGKG